MLKEEEKIIFKNKKSKEIYEMLSEFVEIRARAKICSDEDLNKQYNKCFEKVVKNFSYIPEVHARKYMKYSNHADLVQEGMLGLVMALNNFDMNRSRCFLKLANWYVKTKIKRAANKFDLISVPIYKKEEALQRANYKCLNYITCEDLNVENKDKIAFIKQTVYSLSPMNKKVFCYFYGFDLVDGELAFFNKKSLEKISSELNLSLNTVKKVVDKVNKKINS